MKSITNSYSPLSKPFEEWRLELEGTNDSGSGDYKSQKPRIFHDKKEINTPPSAL
jgi:hypothetical protein